MLFGGVGHPLIPSLECRIVQMRTLDPIVSTVEAPRRDPQPARPSPTVDTTPIAAPGFAP